MYKLIRSHYKNSFKLRFNALSCSVPAPLGTLSTRGILHGRHFSLESTSTQEDSEATANELDTKIPFSELGLNQALVKRLSALGFHTAFNIQAKTLPHSLAGRHVLGKAITGSGKTLAYAVPIVHKLMATAASRHPRALVITPTRELCRQVTSSVTSLSEDLNCVSLYGGDSYIKQERELNYGVDVVCATPGRLNDHVSKGRLSLEHVDILILDEADELLRPGFMEQIESVLECLPDSKQMMLFSATLPSDVKYIIKQYMSNPVTVDLTTASTRVPTSVTHQVMKVEQRNRFSVIHDLLQVNNPQRAIVFTPTKVQASELGSYLSRRGISATALHSDLSQQVRETSMENFRRGRTKVIAATDVAARGIDIPEIDLVIQVDPPPSGIDFYIHRSGRTGRKGLSGTSILLLTPSLTTNDFFRDLKRVVKVKMVSPPSREVVIETGLKNAVESIKNVKNNSLIAKAQSYAKELFDEQGIDALSAALVHISGQLASHSNNEERRSSSFGRSNFGRFSGRGEFKNDRRGFGDSFWNAEDNRDVYFQNRRPRRDRFFDSDRRRKSNMYSKSWDVDDDDYDD